MKKRRGWGAALAALALVNASATAILATLSVQEAWAYFTVMWGILPLAGAFTTYMAVRRGLNNYAAFPVAAVCETVVHWLLIGYPPSSAGMALLNAGVCLIASAAAQVKNERDEKHGNKG